MKKLLVLALAVVVTVFGSGVASASSVLFDRGLPTDNLNNAAGANRSNVQWAFLADLTTPENYYLVGDDFTLAGSGSLLVDTIRVWSTSDTDLSLWFGEAGGTITELAAGPTVTPVTYSGGADYQGTSGSFIQIYQLDFSLNQVLTAGTTYQFFLDGPLVDYPSGSAPWNGIIDAFVHSSNAALSGSTQEGSDNLLLYAEVLNGSIVDVGPWDSNGYGWDKSSDGNVVIFGTAVPEPATLMLFGFGLLGLGARRRARRDFRRR